MKSSLSIFLILLEFSLLLISVTSTSRSFLKRNKPVDPDYQNQTLKNEWNKYKMKHNKQYNPEINPDEDQTRFFYWHSSWQEVLNHKDHQWTVSLNEFSDLSPEEKNKYYLNFKSNLAKKLTPPPISPDVISLAWSTDTISESETDTATPPASVDWRALGKVTPVKNQGQCGSCWAFATIAAFESLNLIQNSSATNTTSNFSEEQQINCDLWNYGCGGGDPGIAMDWAYFNGSASESLYPYTSGSGAYSVGAAACSGMPSSFKQYGAKLVPQLNTNTLMSVTATMPVTVTAYADYWFSYSGGIFSNCTNVTNGGVGRNDHVVLLVGYNSTTWIIKNSWGANWGAGGFIYLDKTNPVCGAMISQEATSPLTTKITANVDPYCAYYSKSYCTSPGYMAYMFGKFFYYFYLITFYF